MHLFLTFMQVNCLSNCSPWHILILKCKVVCAVKVAIIDVCILVALHGCLSGHVMRVWSKIIILLEAELLRIVLLSIEVLRHHTVLLGKCHLLRWILSAVMSLKNLVVQFILLLDC